MVKTTMTNSLKDKKPRLSIVLSPQGKDRIDRVVKMMDAESITDATKDAFRLLEYFLKVSEAGGKILIQMPNEDAKQIEIFGVSTK